jgi:hypothetical protein
VKSNKNVAISNLAIEVAIASNDSKFGRNSVGLQTLAKLRKSIEFVAEHSATFCKWPIKKQRTRQFSRGKLLRIAETIWVA